MSNSRSSSRVRIMFVWIICGLIVGLLIQTFQLITAPQQFSTQAKIAVTGRYPYGWNDREAPDRDMPDSLVATIIEILTSPEMHQRAAERTHALFPEMKACKVTIRAQQQKDSGLVQVQALGTDEIYLRRFLDSLLDEVIAFRVQVRGPHQRRFFEQLFAAFEKQRAAAVASAPGQKEKDIEKAYAELYSQLGWYQTNVEDKGDTVAIFERAGPTEKYSAEWQQPLLTGAGWGALGGFALFYLVSMLQAFRRLASET
jgi:hypothetical protein